MKSLKNYIFIFNILIAQFVLAQTSTNPSNTDKYGFVYTTSSPVSSAQPYSGFQGGVLDQFNQGFAGGGQFPLDGISNCDNPGGQCGSCEKLDVEAFLGNDLEEDPDRPNRKDLKNGFLKNLSDGKFPEIDSVEDFIASMPPRLKSDVVLVEPSRSLQEGRRFLLKSPNSEIVMSFSGHEDKDGDVTKRRGGNAVEMQFWNGDRGVWEYVEVNFENGSKPKVSRNPRKCLNCHGEGENTRPNFDPYNFWSQTIPSLRDELIIESWDENDNPIWNEESQKYLDFLDRVKEEAANNPNSRYGVLSQILMNNDPDQIREDAKNIKLRAKQLNEEPRRKVIRLKNSNMPSSNGFLTNKPGDGAQAVNLFDHMYQTNFCRINKLISDPENNPGYELMKNALGAAALGCFQRGNTIEEFIDKELLDKFSEYFKKKGIGQGTYSDLLNETEQRQDAYFKDRVGRKLWNIEKEKLEEIKNSDDYKRQLANLGNNQEKISELEWQAEKTAYEQARQALESIQVGNTGENITDKERSSGLITPLRYMLEPFGVDTSMFSISVDPLSYTFGDFFGQNIVKYEPFRTMSLNETCESLKEKSIKEQENLLAESKREGDDFLSFIENQTLFCEVQRNEFDGLDALISIENPLIVRALDENRNALKDNVEDIFSDECVGCHVDRKKGAPYIPFDDINKLDNLISKQAGEIWSLRDMIYKRMTRHESLRGSMPMSMSNLTDQDISDVREYLNSFPKRDYIDSLQVVDRNYTTTIGF